MVKLSLEPLVGNRFEPFGRILSAPTEPGRLDVSEALENRREDAHIAITLTHVTQRALPFQTGVMERHVFSSQAFVPFGAYRYVVIVAPHLPRTEAPDMALARSFVARADQGIVYRPDVWHHPMTALDGPARFAVMIWRNGSSDDEEFVDLPEPIEIVE